MKPNGRFVSGESVTRWLKEKVKGKEEAQKLVDTYQHAVAKATIELGNAGCDPATMAKILRTLGHGVGMMGISALEEPAKELAARTGIPLPAIDPEVAKYGDNPADTALDELKDTFGGLLAALPLGEGNLNLPDGKGVMVRGNDTIN